MRIWSKLLFAAPVMAGLLAAPVAEAQWRPPPPGPGWHGGWHHPRGPGPGAVIAGLGAAAIIGGIIASQAYPPPPPVAYPPPPPPPPPPGYYPPPP